MADRVLVDDAYLTAAEVAELRAVLLTEIERINHGGQRTVRTLTEENPDSGQDDADITAADADRADEMRFAERDRKLLRLIRHALSRMDEGEYGACEACGEPIGLPRLRAVPVATACISCKTHAEQLGRGGADAG